MASGLNLTTGRIEEEGMYGGYPSAASSSTGETGDSRIFSSFYTGIPGTSRTSQDVIQEQESFLAVTNDISTPEVLSSRNQDLAFAGTNWITEPSNEGPLHHSFVLDNTLARNHNNPSVWNSFDVLNAHHVYGGSYGTQTAYQASNLDVPMDINRRTSSALGSLSAPTSGGLSDTVSAVSQGYVDTRRKARPRGGRRTGMNLTDKSVKNIRQLREEGGACMRCNALKETCSIGNPCENCLKTQPRIWDGCTRSFEELIDIFKPEILAIRLQSEPLTEFMVAHTSRSYNQHYFDLPLHFGFGKTFNGFKGAEYYPKSSESQYSHAVGSTAEYRDSARYEPSLPVYPTNSNTYETRELVINWLNETLKSGADMENWLTACFGARDVEWVRKLLRTAWKYSVRLCNEPQRVGQDEDQLGENLIYAWFLALLTTMLSFQVTIPSDALPGVMENLQPLAPGHKCSNTSRPINKCVKSLFFNLYSRSVEKVMSALQAFKDTTNPEKLSARDLCHIHCMTILIVVTTAYLQTSLVDDYRFIDPEITDLREKTFNYIREVERAFKNTVLYVRQRSKDWLKDVSSRDGVAPNQVSQFLNGINEIERTYTKVHQITRHFDSSKGETQDPIGS